MLQRRAYPFLEMSGGSVNPTEVTAALINQKDSIVEGIRYAQEMIEGSMTLLLMTGRAFTQHATVMEELLL